MNAITQAETAAFGPAADVAHLVEIVSLALAVEGDLPLQRAIRQSAGGRPDQDLILRLPRASAALALGPRGAVRPIRTTGATAGVDLETLTSEHPELWRQVTGANAKAWPVAQALLESFFVPGSLPARSAFDDVFRWAPLIEAAAYKFIALATLRLDEWRRSALLEATSGAPPADTVMSFYFALNHSMAHLTLLCTDPGAGTWLAGMARSFAWSNWTPSFPLVRERTVWLAAAAAKSAAAFGPDVIDSYLRVVTDSRHVYKVFDGLFGLASIALAHDHTLGPITEAITAAQDASARTVTIGPEQGPLMFQSVIGLLQRWEDDRSADPTALRRLGWDAGAGPGLATRQAFLLDPSTIDVRGQVLGFGALPRIMQAAPGWHYPLRAPRQSPLLPQRHEQAGILTRAWGVSQTVGHTVH